MESFGSAGQTWTICWNEPAGSDDGQLPESGSLSLPQPLGPGCCPARFSSWNRTEFHAGCSRFSASVCVWRGWGGRGGRETLAGKRHLPAPAPCRRLPSQRGNPPATPQDQRFHGTIEASTNARNTTIRNDPTPPLFEAKNIMKARITPAFPLVQIHRQLITVSVEFPRSETVSDFAPQLHEY